MLESEIDLWKIVEAVTEGFYHNWKERLLININLVFHLVFHLMMGL